MGRLTGNYGNLSSTVEELIVELRAWTYEDGGTEPGERADVDQYVESGMTHMRETFAKWLDLPDRAKFTAGADQMKAVLKRLNVGYKTKAGEDEEGKGSSIYGNAALQRVNENASDMELGLWAGESMTQFRDYFINNFDDRVFALYTVAYDLRAALAAMAGLWEEAERNVAGIAEAGLAAAKRRGPAADVGGLLDVIGALSGVVALYPPLAPAAGVVSTGVGLAQLGQGGTKTDIAFGGATTTLTLGSEIHAALDDLSSQVRAAETEVEELARTALNEMTGAAARHYVLQPPRKLLSEDKPGRLVRPEARNSGLTKLVPKGVRKYAGDMDDAAEVLEKASTLAEEARGVVPYAVWEREYGVGYAPAASNAIFYSAMGRLIENVTQTAQSTHDAANGVREVVRLFEEADARVMADLRALERRIEDREERENPPPRPPGRPPMERWIV